jgi:maltose alpha-D-glucosyltransferase/alpha-amylase
LPTPPASQASPQQGVVARIEIGGDAPGVAAGGVLHDPLADPAFARGLLAAIAAGASFRGPSSQIAGWTEPACAELTAGAAAADLAPRPLGAEQSNSSVRFGDRLVLKLYRKLEPGVNPDLEITRFLAERTSFRHIPPLAGGLDLTGRPDAGGGARRREPATLALLQGYVANEGDAWSYSLDALGRYFERARTGWGRGERGPVLVPDQPLLGLAQIAGGAQPPAELHERIGTYLQSVRVLGERTAELHLALASAPADDPAFGAEPFSILHQRSLYEAMRTAAARSLQLLGERLDSLEPAARGEAAAVLAAGEALRQRFARLLGPKIAASRIRTHGDYHLGQVLYTGRDFVILDFEGEPARSLSARRLKRSPLRDVAGMLRSFQYAAHARLFEEAAQGLIAPAELESFETWALYWERWVSATFLGAYLERAGGGGFLPTEPAELAALLDAYLLETAIYELHYELNNRPTWVRIPLAGLRHILGGAGGAGQ